MTSAIFWGDYHLESQNYSSVKLVNTNISSNQDIASKIIEIIQKIKDQNETVEPDDIGVIFIDRSQYSYSVSDSLEILIPRELGWEVNKAVENKRKIRGSLFVSNVNNVKGLEFPFVICVTNNIHTMRNYRNSLYMTLTRSFLQSYLLFPEKNNQELSKVLEFELSKLLDTGNLHVSPPDPEELERIKLSINFDDDGVSFYDYVQDIFDELDVMPIFRERLIEILKNVATDKFDRDSIIEIIEFNYNQMTKQ